MKTYKIIVCFLAALIFHSLASDTVAIVPLESTTCSSDYLSGISQLFSGYIAQNGFELVEQGKIDTLLSSDMFAGVLNSEKVRKIGLLSDSQYICYGNIVYFGTIYTINMSFYDMAAYDTDSFVATATTESDLPNAVMELAEQFIQFVKGKITLIITSNVEAEIFINGQYHGTTPKNIEIAAGSYTLALQRDNYADYLTNLYYSKDDANKTFTINANLEGKVTVTFKSDPSGVEVYAGGNYLGVTPLVTELHTGSYNITFSKHGYYKVSKTVTFSKAGTSSSISADLVNIAEHEAEQRRQQEQADAVNAAIWGLIFEACD